MSKLVDKLKEQSRKTLPLPMGFRSAPAAAPVPQMLFIAGLIGTDVGPNGLVGMGIDAVLLKAAFEPRSFKKMATALGDIPLGLYLSQAASAGKWSESGCDYIVLDLKTPLNVLDDKDLAKILEVKPTLDVGLARSICELPVPVSAALISLEAGEPDITIEHLLICERFAGLLECPLLMSLPGLAPAAQLSSLWEAGVDGVMVPLERLEGLAQLKKEMGNLPRRTRAARKAAAVLPRQAEETKRTEQEEEDD